MRRDQPNKVETFAMAAHSIEFSIGHFGVLPLRDELDHQWWRPWRWRRFRDRSLHRKRLLIVQANEFDSFMRLQFLLEAKSTTCASKHPFQSAKGLLGFILGFHSPPRMSDKDHCNDCSSSTRSFLFSRGHAYWPRSFLSYQGGFLRIGLCACGTRFVPERARQVCSKVEWMGVRTRFVVIQYCALWETSTCGRERSVEESVTRCILAKHKNHC